MLARAIGDRVMQVRLRLQGKVVSALDGIKAVVPGATTRCMSGRGVRPSAAAGRRLTDVATGPSQAASNGVSAGQRLFRWAGIGSL